MNTTHKRKSLFTRVAASLFGDIYGPRRPKTLTKTDVHVANGYLYLGEYQLTPTDAFEVATEILRRLK